MGRYELLPNGDKTRECGSGAGMDCAFNSLQAHLLSNGHYISIKSLRRETVKALIQDEEAFSDWERDEKSRTWKQHLKDVLTIGETSQFDLNAMMNKWGWNFRLRPRRHRRCRHIQM